jgi:hypothetical protein
MPALVLLRRLIFLLLLMFWQGGFTFYAAVVVPIGTDVLNSALHQGMITRQVTQYLNIAGAVALAAWAWDLAAQSAPTAVRQRLRWLLWLFLATLLAALGWLHPRMDNLIDPINAGVLDHDAFNYMHRWYLWLGTAQWAGSIVLTFATLRGWRDADRRPVVIGGNGHAGKTP